MMMRRKWVMHRIRAMHRIRMMRRIRLAALAAALSLFAWAGLVGAALRVTAAPQGTAAPPGTAAPQGTAAPPGTAAPQGPIFDPPGVPMVLVPAGGFLMGSDEGNEEEAPRRRVYLDAFYIDKYPVWNGAYKGERMGYGPKFEGPRRPAVGMNWRQARDHCRALGKRLPTEAEWEKAARGPEGWKFPWGNRWDPDRLIWIRNSGERTHPVDRTARTHASPYGAVDMVGHVWEWVADWYAGDYYRRGIDRNPKGPAAGRLRVLRGGSWYSDDPWDLDAADRRRNVPDFWDNDYGFRCAKSAP